MNGIDTTRYNICYPQSPRTPGDLGDQGDLGDLGEWGDMNEQHPDRQYRPDRPGDQGDSGDLGDLGDLSTVPRHHDYGTVQSSKKYTYPSLISGLTIQMLHKKNAYRVWLQFI